MLSDGVLWCFHQTLILTAPIHWCRDTFIQTWWRNKLTHISGGLRVRLFSSNVHFWMPFGSHASLEFNAQPSNRQHSLKMNDFQMLWWRNSNRPFRLAGEISNLPHQHLCVCKALLQFACNSASFEVFIFVYFNLSPYCRRRYHETLKALFTSRSAREERCLFGNLSPLSPRFYFSSATKNNNDRSRDNWQLSEPISSHLTHIHTRPLTRHVLQHYRIMCSQLNINTLHAFMLVRHNKSNNQQMMFSADAWAPKKIRIVTDLKESCIIIIRDG